MLIISAICENLHRHLSYLWMNTVQGLKHVLKKWKECPKTSFCGLLEKQCVINSISPMCRSAWTPAAPAACGPAPRVPDLGLHRPAQLSAAHHSHGRPGLPRHGPQQDSHHWQDQVGTGMLLSRVWHAPPHLAKQGTPQISLSSTFVIEMTATCKHLKSRTVAWVQASFFLLKQECGCPHSYKLTLLTLVTEGYGWTALGFLTS